MKMTSAVLEFHILFSLWSLLLLCLLLLLFLQVFHFLRDRVLRFGLFPSLCLFRLKDFAYPVADIFQRLQFLLNCGQLCLFLGDGGL